MRYFNRYAITRSWITLAPNVWDVIVLLLVLGLLAGIAWGTNQMTQPYQIGEAIEISLDPAMLPQYAISTVLRMFIALGFSLLFTFTVAPLAAKNRQAEKFLIPFIDIMQSIPILGMLSITVVGFIKLFPNSLLGPECAAIFVIFTSQVWNMALSLYQSLQTVPHDLQEAAKMYHLSPWRRFWRVEVPHGASGLLWNTMLSLSAGWFFVVLSEAIEIGDQRITLPGIGSYINKAIVESNLPAMGYAIFAMFIVILLYDQLLFRPLLAWAEKFKTEIDEEHSIQESWFFDLLAKTHLLKKVESILSALIDFIVNRPINSDKLQKINMPKEIQRNLSRSSVIIWNILLAGSLLAAVYALGLLIHQNIDFPEIGHVIYLGFITAIKVIVLIILASIIWIPIGVWIGLNTRASQFFQPLIQFLAAFPANFFYPLVVILILRYDLNRNVWTMPLMILGTQWYILFNVIAGTTMIPKEMRFAAKNFGVKGWLWWKKLILPAIFPYFITGAMTAAGGCWNASIVAEFVQWGDVNITSIGLGYYIEKSTRLADFPRIALGIAVMCLYVMLFNRLVWQKLYQFAKIRFSLDQT